MTQAYITLDRRQWREVHNALCSAEREARKLFEVLKDGGQGLAALEAIRRALRPAYDQDDDSFSRQHGYYAATASEHGFRSQWSMYDEVGTGDFDTIHPWPDARYVLYDNHWGEHGDRMEPIEGYTWLDLWRAADQAVQQSGDGHHVFIERFTPVDGKPGVLRLSTGS